MEELKKLQWLTYPFYHFRMPTRFRGESFGCLGLVWSSSFKPFFLVLQFLVACCTKYLINKMSSATFSSICFDSGCSWKVCDLLKLFHFIILLVLTTLEEWTKSKFFFFFVNYLCLNYEPWLVGLFVAINGRKSETFICVSSFSFFLYPFSKSQTENKTEC